MSETATLYIISAASGAGKTSLVKALLERDNKILASVSHTTRAARPGEEHAKDYFFVDKRQFASMVEAGDFIEHAQVFDNFYGTAESEVRRMLAEGIDVILEIDWQGAQQVRKLFKEAVSIFIIPPSKQELKNRLQGRGQDSDAIIQRRMQDAVSEMSHYVEFDYLIVNDDFDLALEQLSQVICSQRLLITHQAHNLQPLLHDLLASEAD